MALTTRHLLEQRNALLEALEYLLAWPPICRSVDTRVRTAREVAAWARCTTTDPYTQAEHDRAMDRLLDDLEAMP